MYKLLMHALSFVPFVPFVPFMPFVHSCISAIIQVLNLKLPFIFYVLYMCSTRH